MPDIGHPVRLTDLLVQWRPDWLTTAVMALLVFAYVRARLRIRASGRPWPRLRDIAFTVGVLAGLWTTNGFLQARGHQLMWVWTAQVLLLLLVIPTVLVTAQPIALARGAYGERAGLLRLLDSRPVRWAGNPGLSLMYVPLVTGLLFFGGVGNFTLHSTAADWILHVVLLVIGATIALPLLDIEDGRTSLAVGLTVALSVFELLADAIPGIVLRLETHLEIPFFGLHRPIWAASWLSDQQTAGATLWTVAELLDIPFLVLALMQWMRVERREATRIDAELDRAEAERMAQAPEAAEDGTPVMNRPWWLDNPELRARYGQD